MAIEEDMSSISFEEETESFKKYGIPDWRFREIVMAFRHQLEKSRKYHPISRQWRKDRLIDIVNESIVGIALLSPQQSVFTDANAILTGGSIPGQSLNTCITDSAKHTRLSLDQVVVLLNELQPVDGLTSKLLEAFRHEDVMENRREPNRLSSVMPGKASTRMGGDKGVSAMSRRRRSLPSSTKIGSDETHGPSGVVKIDDIAETLGGWKMKPEEIKEAFRGHLTSDGKLDYPRFLESMLCTEITLTNVI
ncbi:hypothetical protein FOL47_008230 [Perkinsus chesapeaki]|uniref:Uncharacterized protein n=1 Tax=Perkinsus chesapeaki TaxID=330153 RepID=A0A7J6LFJ4_PERCH|nr:hypothetical protein FOL47_008230 [Perkinsus chesapeaki]